VLAGCGDDDGNTGSNGGSGEQSASPASTTSARGGDVKTAYSGNFSQLDPCTGSGGDDHQALWLVYDNLVAYDTNFSPEQGRSLAASWEITEPTTINLKLRPNVIFHDGTPFNAGAVKNHIEYGKTTPTSTVKADLSAIDHVEVVDGLSVVLRLARPSSPLLRVLGDRAGMIISPKQIQEKGPNLARQPVGTGAFQFVEEVLDSRFHVKAFDKYWKQDCPRINTVNYQLGVQPQQGTSGLLSGQFNLLFNPDPNDLPQFEAAKMKVQKRPTPTLAILFFNPNQKPWDNEHVRKAVQYGVDREGLVKTVWKGVHEPAHQGWLGPATGVYFDQNFKGYRYDPAAAKRELAEAGMPNGFEAVANIANAPTAVAQAEFIQANLKQFGINLKLQAKPNPDYYREWYDLKVPAFVAGMSARADVWQQIGYTHAANGPFDIGAIPKGGDLEMQRLFAKVEAIYDERERVPAMRELNQRAHDLAWFVLLYYVSATAVSSPNLSLELYPDGKPHMGQCEVTIKA
jgi:ABC-type transport system substrate-binding protein